MDQVCAGLDCTFVYLDDVLIFSKDPVSHLLQLRLILHRLREHGLRINANKCDFGVPEVVFLGHRITPSGISPVEKHTQAKKIFPALQTNYKFSVSSVS